MRHWANSFLTVHKYFAGGELCTCTVDASMPSDAQHARTSSPPGVRSVLFIAGRAPASFAICCKVHLLVVWHDHLANCLGGTLIRLLTWTNAIALNADSKEQMELSETRVQTATISLTSTALLVKALIENTLRALIRGKDVASVQEKIAFGQ